jgi:two-component system, LytTR family, response regulator
MKVVIIEDEVPAAKHLERALSAYDPAIEVLAVLDGVQEAVAWLSSHPGPDLLLCDIELSDGSALSIFDQVRVRCPVVFCTAYDRYWTEAFAAGGIDYVLKPIEQPRLAAALDKYRSLEAHFTAPLAERLEGLVRAPRPHRQRILAKRGVDHVSVSIDEVAFFTTEHKLAIMVALDGSHYLLDGSLTELAQELAPPLFFRANRKFLIAFHAVESFRSYAKGRVHARVCCRDEPIVVSQESARRFRAWMDR